MILADVFDCFAKQSPFVVMMRVFGDNYSFSSCCLNWERYQREWDIG